MILKGLRYASRKLGPRYPGVILAAQFSLGHIVVLGGIGLLTIYQPMSDANLLRILVAAELLVLVDNMLSLKLAFRMLRPVRAWIRGERGPDATVNAWRTLVEFPSAFVRTRWAWALVATSVPWCIYATWQLKLPWYSVVLLLLGSLVVMAYGVTLRFFGMELGLRPVLEDVARALPDGVTLPPAGVPIRVKLLAGLPLINIVTGVVVAGLSTSGQAKLLDLGLDVVVAVVIAFTLSLELTLLLSRSIMGPIQDLRNATQRMAQGDLSVRVPVLSNDETGSLTQSFNAALAGLQEREKLHQAFGEYVDPDLADKVMKDGAVLEGDDVEVSVLFLDIRDFTAFAERSSAREVVAALNEFWDLVVPVITKHGGHANKFIGDGLLGVFGAPELREDHADRAVAAALELATLIRESYANGLRAGIGVNSGPVVAGTIGGGGRLEFTVIGDAVNTAARVEQATRVTGDDVLITEATRCLLTRDFGEFEPRQRIELKGKREDVHLHAPAALMTAAVEAGESAVAGAD
jgi:class 3 adenylate cyclase